MAKGVSIKFKSYQETIPALLKLINLEKELKKYGTIVIKPLLSDSAEKSTNPQLVESILRYCIQNKNPAAEIYIAEGADGFDTEELFDNYGYRQLAEKYSIGLIDLNTADVEQCHADFFKFEKIFYPTILKESFVISVPPLVEDEETVVTGSLSNMLGAYPSAYYKGLFSQKKSKIKKWPIKYSICDILQCKMPQLAVIDASSKGVILAGMPLEMDKQAIKLFGINWKDIPHLKLISENFSNEETSKEENSV